MELKDIQRVTLPAEVEQKLLDNTKLVEKAKTLLSYNATRVPIYGKLTQTLQRLGIEPLNREQVEAYKASKAYTSWSNKAKMSLAMVPVLVLGIAFIAYGEKNNSGYLYWLSGGIPLAVAMLSWLIHGIEAPYVKKIGVWKREYVGSSLNVYIPDFALSKAVQIQEELGDRAGFYVDSFLHTEEHKPVLRDPDPFLIVEYGGESYYIDVWQEPEFERKTRY